MKQFFLLFFFLFLALFSAFAQHKFIHRGYLGWIRDLSTVETINDAWPSIKWDAQLEKDYDETLSFMKKRGLNEITLWGLFTAKSWDPQVETTIDENRKQLINRWIEKAHQKGIKVLSGVGIYSWGFDKIMQAYPELKCACNAEVMDAANPNAWLWQKRVLDFIMSFDFDGMSMQSADKGRCTCGEFAHFSDLQYHAMLNQKCVDYIRSVKPHYIIGIAGWGMNFGKADDLPYLKEITNKVDYLIDVSETANHSNNYRKQLIQTLAPCAFGTIGSPNIEPIQNLSRSLYFIPTYYRASQQLKALYKDGGRACETYFRTRGNPGDEVTIEVLAMMESNIDADVSSTARQIIKDIYQPTDEASLNALELIFKDAEDAYFANSNQHDIILLSPRETLVSGIPQYLRTMTAVQQKSYGNSLRVLYQRAKGLLPKVKNKAKLKLIIHCIEQTINDLATIRNLGDKVEVE